MAQQLDDLSRSLIPIPGDGLGLRIPGLLGQRIGWCAMSRGGRHGAGC